MKPKVGNALDETESRERKDEVDRMAAMPSRLGGRGYFVKEYSAVYGGKEVDFDSDFDFDFEKNWRPKTGLKSLTP